MADVDAHTALTQTRWGRVVVAIVMVVGAVWIIGPNLPGGPARDRVDVVWSPAAEAGLDQNWSVFSPNPRSQSLSIDAVVVFDDGSSTTWDVPAFDPVVGVWRTYRWRKWVERVRLDANEGLWTDTAAWIADRYRGGDVEPVEVRLTRRWIDHAPLTGDGVADSEPRSFEFYVWRADAEEGADADGNVGGGS